MYIQLLHTELKKRLDAFVPLTERDNYYDGSHRNTRMELEGEFACGELKGGFSNRRTYRGLELVEWLAARS